MTSTTASCWNRCFGKFEIVAETVESNNDELDKKVIALFNELAVDLECDIVAQF